VNIRDRMKEYLHDLERWFDNHNFIKKEVIQKFPLYCLDTARARHAICKGCENKIDFIGELKLLEFTIKEFPTTGLPQVCSRSWHVKCFYKESMTHLEQYKLDIKWNRTLPNS